MVTINSKSIMNILLRSFAVASIATIITDAGQNSASASERSAVEFAQIGRGGGATILAEKETKSNARGERVILHGYDPVAYFKQSKAVKGKLSIRSTDSGVIYYFASKADKADFDKNPAKFEPMYGGFCANSIAEGKLRDTDPNAFHIYKGKLYVHSSPAAEQEFRTNSDANIAKADKNWLRIGHYRYNTESRGFEYPRPFGPEGGAQ
jgi:YHS domain-containing protein